MFILRILQHKRRVMIAILIIILCVVLRTQSDFLWKYVSKTQLNVTTLYQTTNIIPKNSGVDLEYLSGLDKFLNEEKLVGEMNSTIHNHPYGSIKEECDKVNYEPLDISPKTSVILTFHNTETLENLFRTVRSIIMRTPLQLLEEIVLIADNCSKAELTTGLNEKLASINRSDLITLRRSDKQLGLIKARLLGIRVARGPIVVCMDSHMEVQERWLEPLVIEIYHNPRAMVNPCFDWMKYNEIEKRWQMDHGGSTWKTFFDWSLQFGWQEMSHFDLNNKNRTVTSAFRSPVSMGHFAMAKKWFTEIGEFDDGMEAWGGENIDLPLRVWLFGGEVLNVPCSHIAHYEKLGSRSYRMKWGNLILKNYKRMAEVWLDDYKKYLYYYSPELKNFDAGDLSARYALKEQAKHNFTWFLENVYPELGMYDVNSLANNGAINLAFPSKCIHGGGQADIYLYDCMERNTIQQGIFWTMEGDMRYPAYRANSLFSFQKKRHVITGMGVVSGHRSSMNTVWFHWRDGPLVDPMKNLCLEALNAEEITLSECQFNKKSQQWRFKIYTREYLEVFRGQDTKYKSAYLFQLSKILQAYQREEWLDIKAMVQNYSMVLSRWPYQRTFTKEEVDLL